MSKIDFHDGAVVAILDFFWEGLRFVIVALPGLFSYLFFLSAHLAILCLIIALMLIIKFPFNWIIEEMSKI